MQVAILMSTYNGEEFLESQIDSIIDQDYESWHLYIRDDGSSDKTIPIIQQYEKQDPRISLVSDTEGNRGVIGSFFFLLLHVKADLYFFCDQDDFWQADKISKMLNYYATSCKNSDIPGLLYSDFSLIDKNDHTFKERVLGKEHQINSFQRLVYNDVTGCTMLINRALSEKVRIVDASHIVMHDWWFAMIAATYGNIHFFPDTEVGYRQHGTNVVGADSSIASRLRKLQNLEKQFEQHRLQLEQINWLSRRFSTEMASEFKDEVEGFLSAAKKNPVSRLFWLAKNRVKKPTITGTLVFYILFCTKGAIQ